ncbi:DUF4168 domain-containing protein [Acidithiobacillus sp. AMEEHan]|uniref:DUF4168 domain-containing protein n=1 Tax=Acidithiobacillus sp. AMEEHan TaxID=2994951 RepID=UPI0027E4034D|nr:DUF4168 domain-containing protein [Acidithiobacillus sp. AMEEHan]
MKKEIIVGVLSSATLICGSTWALASTEMPAQTTPAEPMVQSPVKLHVDQQELHHFAAAVKEIQPIDMQAHTVISSKSMSEKEKHQKLEGYDKQITAILAQHQLTPTKYEALLKKAETDPAFAKRTEAALHGLG